MKRILINDKKLPLLETLSLIIESQESKSISQAKRLFMEKTNCDEEKADDFVRNVLRNDLPSLRTKDGGKFILGATRMYLDGELQDGETILRLNKIIRFISSSDKINEFDRNLNGLTLNKLSSSLNDDMENSINAKKSELDSNTYTRNSNYDIVRINSFEEASEYSKYTSWCITKEYSAFDSYTNDGINQFYFCLEKGFENVPKVPTQDAPLDKYGLSMIAVCVDESGGLQTCTCRWNHDNGGGDDVMDEKEISEVIGMNFYKVFKPNTIFKDELEVFLETYRNGKGTCTRSFSTSSFDDETQTCVVDYKGKKFNVMSYDGKNLYLKGWAKKIGDCDNFGFRKVFFGNDKGRNEIDCENGCKLVFEYPMSIVWNEYSRKSVVIVRRFNQGDNNVFNLYDKRNRRLISDIWFKYIYEPFSAQEKFYDVSIGNGFNVLNIETGNLVFRENLVRKAEHGFDGKIVGEIETKNGIKKILADKDYNTYKDMVFDDISDCDIYGLHRILRLNGKCNIINKDWKMLDSWYDSITISKSTGVYTVFNNIDGKLSVVMMITPNDEAYTLPSMTPFNPFQ